MDDYTILIDSKEKIPWDFSFYGKKIEVTHLKTGDYTIKGLEDKVIIERKRNTGEVAINIGTKAAAFHAELERMQSIENRFIIFEFSIEDLMNFPKNSGIPNHLLPKIRVTSGFLTKEIQRFENDFDVTIYFCNNRDKAMDKANKILEEIYAKYEITS